MYLLCTSRLFPEKVAIGNKRAHKFGTGPLGLESKAEATTGTPRGFSYSVEDRLMSLSLASHKPIRLLYGDRRTRPSSTSTGQAIPPLDGLLMACVACSSVRVSQAAAVLIRILTKQSLMCLSMDDRELV